MASSKLSEKAGDRMKETHTYIYAYRKFVIIEQDE